MVNHAGVGGNGLWHRRPAPQKVPAQATLDQAKPNGGPGKPANATTGQGVTVHEAKDQPEVATGEDPNDPPRRFVPSKTPE